MLDTTIIAGRPTTRLALGCWVFGGTHWGPQGDGDSVETIRAAAGSGITHFDTATRYGDGHSEQVLGSALLLDRHTERERYFVASKNDVQPTAAAMVESVQTSLRRLGTDALDLYYIHWPARGLDLRPAMEGLEQCRAAGQIRGIGVSNFSVDQMEQVREVGRIDAHQFACSLLWRQAEAEVLPYCLRHGIAGVTYSSIAQGLLTGKFGPEPRLAEGDMRAHTVLFEPDVYPRVHRAVEAMKSVAAEAGRPLVELAIRWVAAQPGCDVVLVGARRPHQLAANLAAAAGSIDDAVYRRLTAISDEFWASVPPAANLWRYEP